MEIQLSPELEQIVNSKVISGRYPNAEEFIREAILRTVENDQVKYVKLNEAVLVGLQEAEKGEFSSRTVQDIIRNKEADKSGKSK